jgi:hypothetical protein
MLPPSVATIVRLPVASARKNRQTVTVKIEDANTKNFDVW